MSSTRLASRSAIDEVQTGMQHLGALFSGMAWAPSLWVHFCVSHAVQMLMSNGCLLPTIACEGGHRKWKRECSGMHWSKEIPCSCDACLEEISGPGPAILESSYASLQLGSWPEITESSFVNLKNHCVICALSLRWQQVTAALCTT